MLCLGFLSLSVLWLHGFVLKFKEASMQMAISVILELKLEIIHTSALIFYFWGIVHQFCMLLLSFLFPCEYNLELF